MSDEFEKLVKQYHDLVMALIRRHYSGRFNYQAEDLAQEVWTKLYQSLKKNENNIVNFKSYLYRTVQTTLWDAARSLDKDGLADSLEESEGQGEDVDEDLLHQRMKLQNLLSRLPEEEARMMRAHLQGFSNGEIAVLLGVAEGRVRNLLTRIKKKLVLMGGK